MLKRAYWIALVYLLLLVFAIPWYLPSGSNLLILGFPLWVLISLSVAFIASVFTAWLYLFYFADDPE